MPDNRPFDLAKLDFDNIRLRKRKKLILWSLPIVTIFIFSAVWLVLPTLLTISASDKFNKAEYGPAASDVSSLHILNLLETYKAYYNQGTTLSAKGEQDAAVVKFETALAYTQDKDAICMITYNLVLTMEGIGDSKLKQVDIAGAITQYTKTLNRLKANKDCFPDSALQERIEKKIEAAEEAKKKQGSSKPNENEEPTEKEPSKKQQEKLKEVEEKANADRRDDQSERNQYEDLPDGVKPW